MRNFDKVDGLGIMQRDPRLIRQNLESWENGAVLHDDKFAFVDLYVRTLAMEESDKRAIQLVRDLRFKEQAQLLSRLYLRVDNSACLSSRARIPLPWTLYAVIEAPGFPQVIFRGLSSINGIVSVIAAYPPVPHQQLTEHNFSDIIFFEGFLIPMEARGSREDNGFIHSELTCSLKLVRAEMRGLVGLGYAEGEFLLSRTERAEAGYNSFSASVMNCRSVLSPEGPKYPIFYMSDGDGEDSSDTNQKRIDAAIDHELNATMGALLYIPRNNLAIIDKMFEDAYKGYL